MPTSSALALGRLLEAGVEDSLAKRRSTTRTHAYISPALYTIPDPAPITGSSTAPVSPSPYVFNRKRRDFCQPEAQNSVNGFEIHQKPASPSDGVTEAVLNSHSLVSLRQTGIDLTKEAHDAVPFDIEIFDNNDDRFVEEFTAETDPGANSKILDSRDLVSLSSYSDAEDLGQAAGKRTPLSNQSEFYDADEEFFSDASVSNASPLLGPSVEVELCVAKVDLFDEIERWKKAEDALARMHNQWKNISRYLSQAGLSCCAPWSHKTDGLLENDLVDKFCQEIVVARFVSEAIGRGLARAEIEAAAEAVVESKNLEISRLRDKLQYYEFVNHEMSKRNQEVVETARRRRQKMRRKQRWMWSFIGMSVTLGVSVLAYLYLPQMNSHLSLANDVSDTSSVTAE